MGNCCFPIRFLKRSSPANPKEVTLLLAGLDNSGKTTVAKRLSEKPLDDVLPTVGFSKVSLEEKGCRITIYDLGGGPQIRDIWPRYYADVHGVIFVIDASDTARIDECRKALEGLLMDSYISGKPVLLLANKQDVEGALDEIDIVDRLNLEFLVNQQKCPTLVELCAARHFSTKMDIGIDNGYKWLLRSISKDYPALNNRVLKDIATQEELERIKRIQKQERIRKTRELEVHESEVQNEKKNRRSLSNQNSIQSGIVHTVNVADAADQINEVREKMGNSESPKRFLDGNTSKKTPFIVSYSSEFFKHERSESDFMLIKNMDEKRSNKNFLIRPKSSGPRLSSTISDAAKNRGPRKKIYKRHNKTAPSPITDMVMKPIGPIPKVFDPTYYTDVGPYTEPVENEKNLTVKPNVEEAQAEVAVTTGKQRLSSASEIYTKKEETQQSSKSIPSSRKASLAERRQKFTSNNYVNNDLPKYGELPPLGLSSSLINRELVLDVINLDS